MGRHCWNLSTNFSYSHPESIYTRNQTDWQTDRQWDGRTDRSLYQGLVSTAEISRQTSHIHILKVNIADIRRTDRLSHKQKPLPGMGHHCWNLGTNFSYSHPESKDSRHQTDGQTLTQTDSHINRSLYQGWVTTAEILEQTSHIHILKVYIADIRQMDRQTLTQTEAFTRDRPPLLKS